MAKASKMRVNIPKNALDLLVLSEKVFAQHQALGGTSPLNAMQDHSWDKDGPKIAEGIALHNKAETLKLEMEKCYRERDLRVAATKETLLASRDVLTGVYRDNMKRMGDWGFSIDDSPKASKAAPKTP